MRLSAIVTVTLLLASPVAPATGAPLADGDGDGYPNAVELSSASERHSFLEWFAAVAEAQYISPSPAWLPEDRDCSGLLRFAFVEALKVKDAEWFGRMAGIRAPGTPPPRSLSWPLPRISRSAFRIAPGPYRSEDVEVGRLVGRATSAELMNFSSVFLGRRAESARRGDLLFYAHPLAEGSGYHSMIYLGDGMVVYHTGLTPEAGGEVRLLSLATLSRHPDPSWHPSEQNPHFLGFYRWKILD